MPAYASPIVSMNPVTVTHTYRPENFEPKVQLGQLVKVGDAIGVSTPRRHPSVVEPTAHGWGGEAETTPHPSHPGQ